MKKLGAAVLCLALISLEGPASADCGDFGPLAQIIAFPIGASTGIVTALVMSFVLHERPDHYRTYGWVFLPSFLTGGLAAPIAVWVGSSAAGCVPDEFGALAGLQMGVSGAAAIAGALISYYTAAPGPPPVAVTYAPALGGGGAAALVVRF